LSIIQDGPHFVRIVPQKQLADPRLNPPLLGPQLAKTETAPATGNTELLPAGMLNFQNSDLVRVLLVYGELENRTLLCQARLPNFQITLKTTCPLTRDEAIYAVTTILVMNGLCVVNDGDRFTQIVPAADSRLVK